MNYLRLVTAVSGLLLLVACEEQQTGAVGLLMSDRIELTAEFAEPITRIEAVEGESLGSGQVVLVQNDERIVARIEEIQATIRRSEALLAEQVAGPRQETIDAARAQVREREIARDFRSRELGRLTGLVERNLTSEESVDLARMQAQTAAAGLEAAQARLAELLAGTRQEQIDQTRFSLEQARAQLAQLQIERRRHTHVAPVAGILDSLPFEVGERPGVGEVVAVLLSGAQPHARVYVPEPVRVNVQPGDSVQVAVDGLDRRLTGTVRRIASEADFTPYFALTASDRSRLSYVAEIQLPLLESRLPDGVPVEAWFEGMAVPGDE